jgi:hypothetical protein
LNRNWVEFAGDGGECISFDISKISTVRPRGKNGSAIICDGQRYEFSGIPYELMLVKCHFFRSPIKDPFGAQ